MINFWTGAFTWYLFSAQMLTFSQKIILKFLCFPKMLPRLITSDVIIKLQHGIFGFIFANFERSNKYIHRMGNSILNGFWVIFTIKGHILLFFGRRRVESIESGTVSWSCTWRPGCEFVENAHISWNFCIIIMFHLSTRQI